MNLSMVPIGDTVKILRIREKDSQQKLLSSMGFLEGEEVTIVAENGGNIIVKIKESRVAIGKEMANRIVVNY